jgi:hypothetical protein
MKSELMERDELVSRIHSHRFKIMQHYLFLYGDRLEGKPCRYDRYNDGKLVGSKEGEACHKSLLVIHQEELKLGTMLDRLEDLSKDLQTH